MVKKNKKQLYSYQLFFDILFYGNNSFSDMQHNFNYTRYKAKVDLETVCLFELTMLLNNM